MTAPYGSALRAYGPRRERAKRTPGPPKYAPRGDDSTDVIGPWRIGLCIAVVTGAIAAAPRAPTPRKGPVLFVIDASGSMSLPFSGISRMSAARHMLQEQTKLLPIEMPVGLMAYGNGVLGCRSARMYNPIEPYSTARIGRIADQMLAAGNTPLAYTLEIVRKRLLPRHPALTVIVISDGAESCGGNPVEQARLLGQAGGHLHLIGLGTGRKVSGHLRAVAAAGGGTYRTAANDREFRRAFDGPLADLRKRKNFFMARKWGMHERDTPIATDPEEFVITAVRQKTPTGATTPVEVDFRFRRRAGSNYFVKIHAIPSPADPGGAIRIGNDEITIASTGAAFYGVPEGTGTATIEIQSGRMAVGPIFVQGELWQLNGVPVADALSNSLRLR